MGIRLLLLLLLLVTPPAMASTPYEATLTCPVGGESFSFTRTASWSSYGSRPDGKLYANWPSPMPLPVCPDNGLVMYKDFSPTEVKQLAKLIASPAYAALKEEAVYYRAAWLMRALKDGDAMDQLWMIAQAAWQADDAPERKARYQREFAEGVAALPRAPDDFGWLSMQGRAVNAWRELGAFARARAVLDALPLAELDVAVPAEGAASADEIRTAKQKRSLLTYLQQLGGLIDRRERAAEPLRLVPVSRAAALCLEVDGGTDAYCNEAPVREAMEMIRKSDTSVPSP